MKKISKKDIGKYVSDLKRKGFDTSVLNKQKNIKITFEFLKCKDGEKKS